MQIFIILNIIKVILWSSIVYLAYNYIDLWKDFIMWISIMGLWLGISIWGIGFFIVLWILKLFSKKSNKEIALSAYKYTSLFAFFIMTNFFLLSFWFWNKLIWIVLAICFLIIWILI